MVSYEHIHLSNFNSLAELNEEWEDYKEPEEDFWYIDSDCETYGISRAFNQNDSNDVLFNKSIGNYFETKEEAEKTLEKLKVWKRLKDKGVRIVGWDYSDNVDLNGCKFNDDDFIVGLSAGDIDEEDLDLLFGGGE